MKNRKQQTKVKNETNEKKHCVGVGWKIVDALSATFFVGFTGCLAFSFINGKCKMNGVDSDRFMKNYCGIPLTLPVNNEEIQVLIGKGFNEEQKECIAKAIEEFDFDVKGVNYKLEFDESKAQKKSVRIEKIASDYSNDLAVTSVKTIGCFGYIQYPVNIDVQVEKVMSSYKELNEKYLNAVIKHEMLHTLGLKDIYDETLKKETLMYCSLDRDGNTLYDLSDSDKQIINTVYRPFDDEQTRYAVTTTLPKKVEVTFSNEKEEAYSL